MSSVKLGNFFSSELSKLRDENRELKEQLKLYLDQAKSFEEKIRSRDDEIAFLRSENDSLRNQIALLTRRFDVLEKDHSDVINFVKTYIMPQYKDMTNELYGSKHNSNK
jgi:chromosome segregation ATPase